MLSLFCLALFVISILAIIVDDRPNEDAAVLSWWQAAEIDRFQRNTTVIILNWSRLRNVIRIVSDICDELLDDTVHSIIVWNNNPNVLAFQDFQDTSCPQAKLRIINSAENLYFQARYLACAEATTLYCFIQDDDYFVLPEIIRALSRRIGQTPASGIHLQPPDEMLKTVLRTTVIGRSIHTTFVWLGYGTIIRRSYAVDFLSLLDKLNVTVEERQMADNYFTLLSNSIPERWFDTGIELGGGQPFTVGSEGEERNNRHIIRATEILQSIMTREDQGKRLHLPYITLSEMMPEIRDVFRAPCHGSVCVFETSITLLPAQRSDIATTAHPEVDVLGLEARRYGNLGSDAVHHYLSFPPSHAVDGRHDTAFRSPDNAKQDDWISLDLTRSILFDRDVDLVLFVDQQTENFLLDAVFESSLDGTTWASSNCEPECGEVLRPDGIMGRRKCRVRMSRAGVLSGQHFRARLLGDQDDRWTLYELYVDSEQSSTIV
ncbi:hypothetical protein B0H34DRAFT_13087 [Crassisporium funariophilum]|nr:hypothetical protein B0H34DRAFT_13087 [Crassisporium funariophilum]